jgi:hypothetical protein
MIAAGMAAVHELTGINPTDPQIKNYLAKADAFYTGRREKVKELTSLALLDSMKPQVLDYTDSIVKKIDAILNPPVKPPVVTPPVMPPVEKKAKTLYRNYVFQAKRFESEEEIDIYISAIRKQLKDALQGVDIVDLK